MPDSSSGYAAPLTLEPRPTPAVAALIGVPHGAALVIALALPLPWAVRLVGAFAVAAGMVRAWRRHVRATSPGSVSAAVWDAAGRWVLYGPFGQGRTARLLPASYVGGNWMILNFALLEARGRRTLLLGPASVDAETMRRLRVRLRLERGRGGAGQAGG